MSEVAPEQPVPALAEALCRRKHPSFWAVGQYTKPCAECTWTISIIEPELSRIVAEGPSGLRVRIEEHADAAATCRVWRNGVLVFAGQAFSAGIVRDGGQS